jgi:hypothetical protein
MNSIVRFTIWLYIGRCPRRGQTSRASSASYQHRQKTVSSRYSTTFLHSCCMKCTKYLCFCYTGRSAPCTLCKCCTGTRTTSCVGILYNYPVCCTVRLLVPLCAVISVSIPSWVPCTSTVCAVPVYLYLYLAGSPVPAWCTGTYAVLVRYLYCVCWVPCSSTVCLVYLYLSQAGSPVPVPVWRMLYICTYP